MNPPTADQRLTAFSPTQIPDVNSAVSRAEELVSDHYKMSTTQWFRLRYDIRTLADLDPSEIVFGPYAQVIRYIARPVDKTLGSASYDFYKICLQDHAIIETLSRSPQLALMPFCLYIVAHELIHIVRFCRFLQNFEASAEEKMAEEIRVHEKTQEILSRSGTSEMGPVFRYFDRWQASSDPLETLR